MPRFLRIPAAIAAFAAGVALIMALPGLRPSLAAEASTKYADQSAAPGFPTGLDWLNTGGQSLDLDKLRGKVVLLDFWTYGCINCVHIIPDLERLEHDYADELVVIGVHTPKFDNEGRIENVRNITLRYGLQHPVVNDPGYRIWNSYGVNAWPTQALIAPDGGYVGSVAGEGNYELLNRVIGEIITEFDATDGINRESLGLVVDGHGQGVDELLFPGNVLADEKGRRLFIADSNHNRIVVTDFTGKVLTVIGNREAALADGDYANASFYRPQGMTLVGDDTLYIADTSNSALRRVDLERREVTTVAGTGTQGYLRKDKLAATGAALNSPWDVLHHDGLIYIAMAGQHQIWLYDPKADEIRAFAGSRREELKDGPRSTAGLNQPSGLATDGEFLYVADSEASAIRRIGLGKRGKVDTIVGEGLFEFGDVDGQGATVRLQHPKQLFYIENRLLVADTYNSKIKTVEPVARTSRTFFGGAGELDEPGGLSIAAGRVFIADTNHHRIVTTSLDGSGEATELPISDPEGFLR